MNVSFPEFCTRSTQTLPSLLFLNEFPQAMFDKFKDTGSMAQTSICRLCSLFYDSLQRFLQNHLGFTTLVLPFYDIQKMIHTHVVAICESDILHTEGEHVSSASPEGKYKGRQPSPPYESFWVVSSILHKLVKHMPVVLFVLKALY